MPWYLAVSPSSGPPGTIWRTREEPSSSWHFTSLFSFSFPGKKKKKQKNKKTPFAVSLCGKHLQSWKSQVLTRWAEAGLMGRKPAVLSVARYANRYISTTKWSQSLGLVGLFRSFVWGEIKTSAEQGCFFFPLSLFFYFPTQCRDEDQGKISLNANRHSVLAFMNCNLFMCR